MKLQIKDINEANWREVVDLTVANAQTSLIETNAQSLLEAAYDTSLRWRPLALYRDAVLVGFSMIGAYDEIARTIWLDRLMIGQAFQKQGLGRLFLREILNFIKSEYPVKIVYLSFHEENLVAAKLYLEEGFHDLQKIDPTNGEHIFYYEYENSG